ncbi:TetR/AcrR family transcriptional regulator [Microbacterium aureliae]
MLDAAVEIFGSKGFAGGTLQEIADQVGMTHAGILHHFGSKDQLLLEVRTAIVNAHRAGIVQAYVVLSAESVTDDHPGRTFFQKRYETLRGEVAQAFRVVCAERGITAPETIDLASAGILAVMDGLQLQWLLDPGKVDLARASEFAIEAIVDSVIDAAPSPLA